MRNDLEHDFLHSPGRLNSFTVIWSLVKWLGLALIVLFLLSTALRAFSEAYDNDNFPEALLVKVELLPFIFPLHMATGGLALLLVPLTYFLRFTRYHKWMGRLTAADIIVAGLTALPVAVTAPVAPMAAAGFSTQAIIWLALLAKGIWHIKRHEIAAHRSAMLMVAAVTSGALFFRIYLALWAIFGTFSGFKTFYACDSWMAWVLPLAITTFINRRHLFAKRGYAAPAI
jgi:hypothetical protein